jgi:hypothetical protein
MIFLACRACLLFLFCVFPLIPLSYSFVTSVYFLQILGGSTHDKEFILKLIMDTVYPVEIVPIMVKI